MAKRDRAAIGRLHRSIPIPVMLPDRFSAGLPKSVAFPVFDPQRGTYDIFIANADGTGRKKIKEEASQPCLSPDGTQIAYCSVPGAVTGGD